MRRDPPPVESRLIIYQEKPYLPNAIYYFGIYMRRDKSRLYRFSKENLIFNHERIFPNIRIKFLVFI